MTNPKDRYDSLLEFVWGLYQDKYAPGMDLSVDWRLAKFQMLAESEANPRAISPVGARGLFQLMPATWGTGFENEWPNPELNMHRGIEHLWTMWKLFKEEGGIERWKYALGAYNCGQGWIIKSQAFLKSRGKATDQWKLIIEVLPQFTGPENARETMLYVGRIISAYGVAAGWIDGSQSV